MTFLDSTMQRYYIIMTSLDILKYYGKVTEFKMLQLQY